MAGVITDLKVQKRNRERVNVYLDGEFAFGLPLSEAARLRRGQFLSDEDIERLKAMDAYARARDAALRYLASRPRSEAEVRQYLARKGFDDPTVNRVIGRLHEWGYLDDEAFARSWVQDRERFRPQGHRRGDHRPCAGRPGPGGQRARGAGPAIAPVATLGLARVSQEGGGFPRPSRVLL